MARNKYTVSIQKAVTIDFEIWADSIDAAKELGEAQRGIEINRYGSYLIPDKTHVRFIGEPDEGLLEAQKLISEKFLCAPYFTNEVNVLRISTLFFEREDDVRNLRRFLGEQYSVIDNDGIIEIRMR